MTRYDEAELPYRERKKFEIDAGIYAEIRAISGVAAQALHAAPGNAALRDIEARLGALLARVVPL